VSIGQDEMDGAIANSCDHETAVASAAKTIGFTDALANKLGIAMFPHTGDAAAQI
jgi:hypothetical protein